MAISDKQIKSLFVIALILGGALFLFSNQTKLLDMLKIGSESPTFFDANGRLLYVKEQTIFVQPEQTITIESFAGYVHAMEPVGTSYAPKMAVLVDNDNPIFAQCNGVYSAGSSGHYECTVKMSAPKEGGAHKILIAFSNFRYFSCFAATRENYDKYYVTGKAPTIQEYEAYDGQKYTGIVPTSGECNYLDFAPASCLKPGVPAPNSDCTYEVPERYSNYLIGWRDLSELNYVLQVGPTPVSTQPIPNNQTGSRTPTIPAITLPAKPDITAIFNSFTNFFKSIWESIKQAFGLAVIQAGETGFVGDTIQTTFQLANSKATALPDSDTTDNTASYTYASWAVMNGAGNVVKQGDVIEVSSLATGASYSLPATYVIGNLPQGKYYLVGILADFPQTYANGVWSPQSSQVIDKQAISFNVVTTTTLPSRPPTTIIVSSFQSLFQGFLSWLRSLFGI